MPTPRSLPTAAASAVPSTRWASVMPPLADADRTAVPSRRRPRASARRGLGEAPRVTLLEQFTAAMQAHGQPVLASRMRGNRHYAMRCLAEAHAHGDQALRLLATRLFEIYQGEPLQS